MKVQFTSYQGTERKPLVKAIEEIANRKGKYRISGELRYAFDFGGGLELHRDGTLKADGCVSDADNMYLLAQLHLQGFTGTVLDRGDDATADDTEASDSKVSDTEVTDTEADDTDMADTESVEAEAPDTQGQEQPDEDAGDSQPKQGGILDTLVDEFNANAEDGEQWTRLHSAPQMEYGDGKWRNLDGTFASTAPAFEDLNMDRREELGLGCTRRENLQGETGMSASDVPDTITIEIPFTGREDILHALLQIKATLIISALGEDACSDVSEPQNGPDILPIEFEDGKAKFEWLRFGTDGEVVQAWSAFLCAAVKFSKKAKRVTARDTVVENEKFAFRVFLVRLGMNDAKNKVWRRLLMRNLKGDAAFATTASKEKWLAKHGAKKNTNEEADINENAE